MVKIATNISSFLKKEFYTKTETDTKLSSKSDTSHTHDDRYYTETEIDSKLANISPEVDLTDYVTQTQLDEKIGDIETTLNNILGA